MKVVLKIVCSYLNHGNSAPERCFSMTKIMLSAHSYTGSTTEALHLVKGEQRRVDGVIIFIITTDLILVVKEAYGNT